MKVHQFVFFVLKGCVLCINAAFAELPANAQALSQRESRFQVSEELEAWNKKQKIHLQKHQLVPIDYLEKSQEIYGLIINHQLGTGKTLLSIGFAERNPESAVVILAPDFLHSHWLNELDKYGVKNKSRYRFLGHNACQALTQEDLSNTIVIIDESHRFIQKVRSQAGMRDNAYSLIYFNLRKARRVLALSGTPIYNDMFDLIYLINLVAGRDVFPFNHEQFRINLSKVNELNAYWRGHLLTSLYLVPYLSGVVALFAHNWGVLYYWLASYSVSLLTIVTSIIYPISEVPGRAFDILKLKDIIQKYISYYNFDTDVQFYPTSSLYREKLAYSKSQLNFLYTFYDSRLKNTALKQLLKDHDMLGVTSDAISRDTNLDINSSAVQDFYKGTLGAGREIGNLLFKRIKKEGGASIIVPEKFRAIVSTVEAVNGPVVIYSHYYHNGLLYFKQFLDALGYEGRYRIFHPEMAKEEHADIINAFNTGKIKMLLLHPDITEGISLKGTRQLHFLDIPTSSALRDQIIGRTVRYQSHMHLPQHERHVGVYFWEYHIDLLDEDANLLLRKNWHLNFAEGNYYAQLGQGRIEVDPNAWSKAIAPDTRAYQALSVLNKHMEAFQAHMRAFSIESTCYPNDGINAP